MQTGLAELLTLALVLPICGWVAWSDLTRMTIPNRAVMALVLVFLVCGPLLLPLNEFALRLVQFGIVLAITFGLTMGRLIGAGDAKFVAAMALYVDSGDASAILLLTTAVLLVAFALHRAARASAAIRGRTAHWESWQRREFPMGIAFGGALAIYLPLAL